jgi:hypothetical protein
MANSDSGTHDYLLRFCEAEWSCDSIIRTLSPADLSFDVFNFNKSLNAATFLGFHRKTNTGKPWRILRLNLGVGCRVLVEHDMKVPALPQ